MRGSSVLLVAVYVTIGLCWLRREGCQIEGRLRVKRIPGNFHINFVHDNMDYHNSLINATHSIDYLIFSNTPLPKPMTPNQVSMHNVMAKIEGGRHRLASSNTMHNTEFVSNHEDRTYEHFIQIGASS